MNAADNANTENNSPTNYYNDKHWMVECYAQDGSSLKERLCRSAAALNGASAIHDILLGDSMVEDTGSQPINPYLKGQLNDGLHILIALARDEVFELLSSELFQAVAAADKVGMETERLRQEKVKSIREAA